MKRETIFMSLLMLPLALCAGEKLTLNDVTGGTFVPRGIAELKPLSDGRSFARISDDGCRIVRCSFLDGKETATLFDSQTARGDSIAGIEDYLMSADDRRVLIQTASSRIYRRSLTAAFYVYDIAANTLTPLSKAGAQQTPLWSPDGSRVAFVRNNDIWLTSIGQPDSERQVTTDGRFNEVINGIPDWVNEEEFGTNRSMVFSADGRHLLWIRYDERAVRQYSMPLFKGLKPEREEYSVYPGFYTYKYPVAGEQNASVSLWTCDIESGQKRQLSVPLDADGYIPRIFPVPGSPLVAVLTLNRHQDRLCIYMVNPADNECRLVIDEHAEKYVREEAYSNLQITSRHILLPSDRDGYMHLYLYSHDGRLERQVESGSYEVADVYGYDERTGDTYYASHEPFAADAAPQTAGNAAERQVWVARKNGSRLCLTPQAGWHAAQFSADFKHLVHTWSDINTPPRYALCDNKGKQRQTLVDNQELQQRLAGYDLGTRQLFTLTTSDGVVLNGWMVRPAGFNASRRYPVIMYQYGGPGSQQVTNRWGIGMSGRGALMEQYLAQQGYICVCVDNRGTGGRGADFEKCTYLKLGQLEAHDQAETALWLSQQPWVDGSRIAIWGWSFGGFNTLMAMSEGRGLFRCGIAIAPPTSWRYYDTIYTERFMRTPQENARGYDVCPVSRAGQLSGALLLCHGMADDNVHFRNTAELTEALVQADKDFRQLVYTNRNHSIYGGNTRKHLFRQCINFFNSEME